MHGLVLESVGTFPDMAKRTVQMRLRLWLLRWGEDPGLPRWTQSNHLSPEKRGTFPSGGSRSALSLVLRQRALCEDRREVSSWLTVSQDTETSLLQPHSTEFCCHPGEPGSGSPLRASERSSAC